MGWLNMALYWKYLMETVYEVRLHLLVMSNMFKKWLRDKKYTQNWDFVSRFLSCLGPSFLLRFWLGAGGRAISQRSTKIW